MNFTAAFGKFPRAFFFFFRSKRSLVSVGYWKKKLQILLVKTVVFVKGVLEERKYENVEASNIGYTKPKERSQGKGGDLRSKYDLTLTVVRKQYNGRGLFGKACRTALDTLSCCAPVPAGFTT